MGWNTKGKRKGRSGMRVKFNPNHSYIEDAVDVFIDGGGKITKLEFEPGSNETFKDPSLVDEFLLGK